MNVRALALSQRIDELLATSDPLAIHESVTSYLDCVEEPLLQKWLLSSIQTLDEQSADALRQELTDEQGSGATLAQAIVHPRAHHELANSLSRFLSHQPRAMANLAPPLLAGYLTYISSLQGEAPRKKPDTRVLAGVVVAALGMLLFLRSFGTTDHSETPVPSAPIPLVTSGPALKKIAVRPHLTHARKAFATRQGTRRARRHAIAARRRQVQKRNAVANIWRGSSKHHQRRYARSGGRKHTDVATSRFAAAQRAWQRQAGAAAHRRSRKTTIASNNRSQPPHPFHGIFKPFRWVLFKPVHRGPG